VQITSAHGGKTCLLDTLLANPIGSLTLSDAGETLRIKVNLNILGDDNVTSSIQNGASLFGTITPGGIYPRLRIGGGTTTINSGAIIGNFVQGSSTFGSLYVDGGSLQFTDLAGNAAAIDLHFSIMVNAGDLSFKNALTPINVGPDPTTASGTILHYANVTCNAGGSVKVFAANGTGWSVTAPPPGGCTVDNNVNQGAWTVTNTGKFYFGEPIYQDGGTFTISQGSSIKLDNSTGIRGGTGGTRDHSFFMSSTGGTIELQGDANAGDACGLLDVGKGLMMDGGTLLCSATTTQNTTGYSWKIQSEAVGSEFLLNGGTVQIGNDNTFSSTGQLQYTGPDPQSTAIAWAQGQFVFNWDASGNYSAFWTNTKVLIGLSTPPPNPPTFSWLGGVAPNGTYALLFSNGVSRFQDPAAGTIWTSDWNTTTWGVHR
jgi:hypothetical protein